MPENNYETSEFGKPVSKSDVTHTKSACIEKLIRTNKAMCVLPIRSAMYFVKNNLDSRGNPLMKVSDLSLNFQYVGFLYEKASPFAEKFNKLIQRMIDFGVFPDLEMSKVTFRYDFEVKSENTDCTIVNVILGILLIGYGFSTVIFVHEIRSFSKSTKRLENKLQPCEKKTIRHYKEN